MVGQRVGAQATTQDRNSFWGPSDEAPAAFPIPPVMDSKTENNGATPETAQLCVAYKVVKKGVQISMDSCA